jgi:aspartate kinase
VTTLGRGGSDTSAVALAAALNADACEIYSDVDGVFTADPRVVPQARRLAEISYQEMQTMAGSGARVLNAQAVEFARRAGIAIHARATAGGEGTLIRGEPEPDRLAAVCGRKDLVRLTLRPARRLPELLDLIEACHADPAELWCDTAQGHATALVSCENLHDAGSAAAALTERLPELDADEATGTVCIVGACSGRAARLRAALRALSDAGLTPSAVSADPLRTLFVLPSAQIDDAVRLLHLRLIERDS